MKNILALSLVSIMSFHTLQSMTDEKVKDITIRSTIAGAMTAVLGNYWLDTTPSISSITKWGTMGALLTGLCSYWYSSQQTRKSRFNRAVDLMSLADLNKKQLLDTAQQLMQHTEESFTVDSEVWKSFISDLTLFYSGSRYFLFDTYSAYRQMREGLYEAHTLLNLAQQAPRSTLPQFDNDQFAQKCTLLQKAIKERLESVDKALVALKKHPGFYMHSMCAYPPIEYHVGIGMKPTDNSSVWIHTQI